MRRRSGACAVVSVASVSVASVAVVSAAVLLASACGGGGRATVAARAVTTTTDAPSPPTTVPAAPAGSFMVATPASSPLQYSATPDGPPVGTLPTLTWGDPTVRPVLSQTDTSIQIGLDTRPNQSSGWVPRAAVTLAITAYRVEISISTRTLTLFLNGNHVYSAPVGVGKAQWPTPLGHTFIDALVDTPKFQQYIYGPRVVVLGIHSEIFTEFDGGDGTVAIHGYPSDPGSANGVASSHGCIRVSPDTIHALEVVPLGSPVDIIA